MYAPGARFEVRLAIKLGDQVFEPGLRGTITGGVAKMVGKSYSVKFDDGRAADIHMTVMSNQVYVIGESGELINPKDVWGKRG